MLRLCLFNPGGEFFSSVPLLRTVAEHVSTPIEPPKEAESTEASNTVKILCSILFHILPVDVYLCSAVVVCVLLIANYTS